MGYITESATSKRLLLVSFYERIIIMRYLHVPQFYVFAYRLDTFLYARENVARGFDHKAHQQAIQVFSIDYKNPRATYQFEYAICKSFLYAFRKVCFRMSLTDYS